MPPEIHSSKMSPEQRKRLHPDFLKNEDAYWKHRETLLTEYEGNGLHTIGTEASSPAPIHSLKSVTRFDKQPFTPMWSGSVRKTNFLSG